MTYALAAMFAFWCVNTGLRWYFSRIVKVGKTGNLIMYLLSVGLILMCIQAGWTALIFLHSMFWFGTAFAVFTHLVLDITAPDPPKGRTRLEEYRKSMDEGYNELQEKLDEKDPT